MRLGTGRGYTAALAFSVVLNACLSSSLAAILPVVLTRDLGASYAAASALIVAGTLVSTVVIHGIGTVGDRERNRFPVAIASAVCGLLGALVLSLETAYWGVFLVFSTFMAVAASLFPQFLALAFVHRPGFAPHARALASAGWVVGPPLGGAIVGLHSPEGLFVSVACGYAILALGLLLMSGRAEGDVPRASQAPRPVPQDNSSTSSTGALVAVLAALHFMMAICALGIPWRILEVGGSEFQVGLAFAIAAAVEIPLIAFADRIRRAFGHRTIILAASGTLAAYFLAMALFESVGGVLAVSVANGVVTGVMMGLSLIVLQERMPGRAGRASALYSNILRLSYVGALVTAGAIAQWVSVVAIFWVAAALALATSFVIVVNRPLDD